MKNKIDYFLNEFLDKLTLEEADLISQVLKWDDEQRIAFKLAKDIFESFNEEEDGLSLDVFVVCDCQECIDLSTKTLIESSSYLGSVENILGVNK